MRSARPSSVLSVSPLVVPLAALIFAAAAAAPCSAQVTAAAHSSSIASVVDDDSGVPQPAQAGFNASLASAFTHDSQSGWSSTVTPALSWRFNPVFSADASLPVFLYVNAVKTDKAGVTELSGRRDVLGDAAFATHLHPELHSLDYIASLAFTAPTGNQPLGLSAGRPIWNWNNHFETSAGLFSPDLEAG